MSYKLYLFCVETTRQCNSDWIYIRKAIDFLLPNKDLYGIFRPIYLETKYKYNDKGIIKQIKDEKKEFAGECEVIYCIDLDNYSVKPEDYNKFCEIEKYCKNNGYHLAYFSRTIEEVFIGQKIHSSDKKIEAAKFLRTVL